MAVFNNILAGAAGQGGAAAAEHQVERSLRFSRNDSAYLNFTPSSAGNRKTWTWSAWVKRSYLTVADYMTLFGAIHAGAAEYSFLTYNTSADTLIYFQSSIGSVTTNAVFRDNSAWAHICLVVDTTQSTAANAFKIYVNGSLASTIVSGTHVQNLDTSINNTLQHCIGSNLPWAARHFDGYIAETYLIDGQALAASDFGEYDDNNVWQPKAYSGTYGTNGWYLNFSDATSTTTIAEDQSGNGNDWTANNISVTAGSNNDSLFDSPKNGTQSDTGAGGEVSGNYCTFNNAVDASHISGNGALEFVGSTGWNSAFGTMLIPSSGKWYWEMTALGANNMAGIVDATDVLDPSAYIGTTAVSYLYNFGSGNKIEGPNNTQTNYGPTGGNGDVMRIALDMDAGTITFYQNAISEGVAFTGLTGSYLPVMASYTGSGGLIANFGQRPFAYSAPSGYKCLCTANLPDPTIADGSAHFDAKTYTGNGSTQSITTAFSPDFVWIKRRSYSQSHQLVDTVRGYDKYLFADVADDELTDTDRLTSFNSDGFTIGADSNVNTNGGTYVGWAWDGGSSTVTNTDGDITSSVRANTSAGFSIVSYPGSSAIQNYITVGHGLNATPEVIIVKNRTYTSGISWRVYHASAGENKSAPLDTNDSFSSGYWNATAPTSSVFSVTNSSPDVNNFTNNYIAYCWTSIEGYSKFSEYTGNGSADGTFVYTGFRPRWILIKRKDANANWRVLDTARRTYNPINKELYPSLSNAEATFTALDVLSNGFKFRTADSNYNATSNDYVYMAFAEHPFKTARAF